MAAVWNLLEFFHPSRFASEEAKRRKMNVTITPQAYDAAEEWCHEVSSSNHEMLYDPECFRRALHQTSYELGFPVSALQSLMRNASVCHIKKTAPAVKRRLPNCLEQYKEGRSILEMAKDANFSPYLLARYLVEEVTTLKGRKKLLSEAMRDPEGVLGDIDVITEAFRATEGSCPDIQKEDQRRETRLAREVREATNFDPLYGPMHDKERHVVGIEYEVVLEQELHTLGIPFETETDLRDRGTSRTPDILLSCPMGVQVPKADGSGHEWKIICWIDSKAMFGDVGTHQTSVLPQAEAYVHRYGPGMILYWFGHAPVERLGNSQGDIVIVSYELPDSFKWPTGETFKRDT